MEIKGNSKSTIKKEALRSPLFFVFWDNLQEGQKFIHWDMDFLPCFSVKIVRVSRVWTNRMGFDADVTYVTDYLLYSEKKSWSIGDCPVLVPLSQKTYDAMFLMTWKAMRHVQQLFLNARQILPSDNGCDSCFVLENSLTNVRFGRKVLGADWEGEFESLRWEWYHYDNFVVDTYYMRPSECSHDRAVVSGKVLFEESLYFISTSTFRRAKRICNSALSHVKSTLYPAYEPQEQYGRWGFVDTKNTFALPCVWKDVTPFIDGYAAVKDDSGKWGVIDLNGELRVPCGGLLYAHL